MTYIISLKSSIKLQKILNYEDHKYIRNHNIKKDIYLLSKYIIKHKCKDYNYFREFVKEIAIKNKFLCNKPSLLCQTLFLSNNPHKCQIIYKK